MGKRFCGVYIDHIFEFIISTLQKNKNVNINSNNIIYLKRIIEKEIFQKVFKSLVYCMNVKRLDGELIGNTPEERYLYFSETEQCINVMNETFPNMKEQLYTELAGKCIYISEILNELQLDKEKIYHYFFISDDDILVELKNGGDWHNDKCVLIFKFESGKKIVYKPTRGDNITFLKGIMAYFFENEYVDKYDTLAGTKGAWIKFVEHIELKGEYKIKEFYYNYGKLLFIAYILGMNDLHYENLIACGKYPVITDVETIFSSYLFFETHEFNYNAQYKAVRKLLYGIMATGMVPIFSMTEYFGGDVSCLSNKGIKVQIEKLKNEYRDDMYIYSEYEIIREYKHLPSRNVEPMCFSNQIAEGFKEAMAILNKIKVELIKYILDNMEIVESRIILNMTKGYSKILRIKSDPRYRNNPNLFERLLITLKQNNQFNNNVYEHEVKELRRGNIPSFYWKKEINGVYGYLNDKLERITDLQVFTTERLHQIIQYQTMNSVLVEQIQLIFDSINTNIALGIEYKNLDQSIKKYMTDHKSPLLLENINKTCIDGNDGTISWIGLMVNDKEQLEYAILDWSIYSGIIGVGYMYLSEYDKNKSPQIKGKMNRIYYTIVKAFNAGVFDTYDISYFCGLTGIYAFLVQLKEKNIIDTYEIEYFIEKIVFLIKNNISKTSIYDTLSGIHSAVIYYYGRYKIDDNAGKIISLIRDFFEKKFEIDLMRKNFNFASFAHGYSGVLTSVMCMHKTKKTIKTKSLISELVKAEETLHVNNFLWKDMRSKDQKYSHYWCHGSLGIMYSRLIWKNLNLTDELNIGESNFTMILEQYKKQITSGVLDSQNYSLCHGNFAFVDFLISYMKIFGYDQKISDYISKIKNKGEKYGYSCIGAPGAINSIGYMVGEAGIQYLLNRIENLNNPSILSIETI